MEVGNAMLEAVTTAMTTVISWVGSVITALTGSSGALNALLPLFAVGIAISAVLLGKHVSNAEVKGFKFGETLIYKTIPSQA